MMLLENKSVMITGTNGGLGIALVREALVHNAKKVYCCVRDISKSEALQQLDARVRAQCTGTPPTSKVLRHWPPR